MRRKIKEQRQVCKQLLKSNEFININFPNSLQLTVGWSVAALSSCIEKAMVSLGLGQIRTSFGRDHFTRFFVAIRLLSHVALLLVRSHQAETIIVKRLIQRRNIVTRVRVEPRSCNRSRGKSDAF